MEEAIAAEDEVELLCVSFGADIGDHLCEEIEHEGATRCGCACHEDAKRVLRLSTRVEGARS